MADTEAGTLGGQKERTSEWKAFHQAYDSALRAYRRGGDVARAVNWLYLANRPKEHGEDTEYERKNREYGIGVGEKAGSEEAIAPEIWSAAEKGEIKVPGFEDGNYTTPIFPMKPDGQPLPPEEKGKPIDPDAVDGLKPSSPEEEGGGDEEPAKPEDVWEYVL